MEPMQLATEESDEIDQVPPQHGPQFNVVGNIER